MHEGSTDAQADGSMPRPFSGTTVRAVVHDIGAKFSEAGLRLRVLSDNPCKTLPLVHPCSWLASLLTSNATRRTSLCRPALLRLEKNTLYHELHDTEVSVLSMLRQGLGRASIQQAIEELHKDGTIDADKQKNLLQLVQSLSGGLLDTDDVRFSANAQFIAKASHNAASHRTVEDARASLQRLVE